MIRTVLVAVKADGTDDAAFWTALVAARQFEAHLEFLLVRTDPQGILVASGAEAIGSISSSLLADLENDDRERAARARRFCQNFCDREQIIVTDKPPGPHGMSAAWREERGDEASEVMRHARFNDLLIVSPPRQEQGLDADTISTVLIGSGRPVLLAPTRRPASLTRTVVIAWKETPEAARAVMSAMPFLEKADKVIVLSIGETDAETTESAEKLAEQLRWHRLDVEARCLAPAGGSAPETLVGAAANAKADLIVMGGYSRNRVRELIFGGFTQHVLNGVELPVLLCH
jgi:nucleotide-binding universal stress UspA family protein